MRRTGTGFTALIYFKGKQNHKRLFNIFSFKRGILILRICTCLVKVNPGGGGGPDLYVKKHGSATLKLHQSFNSLKSLNIFFECTPCLEFLGHSGTHSAEHRQTGRDNEGKYFVFYVDRSVPLCTIQLPVDF